MTDSALPDAPYSSHIQELLGQHPSSTELSAHINALASLASLQQSSPEVKSYPDCVYLNYFSLGMSLLFKPINGYKPKSGQTLEDLRDKDLILDGVDFYNTPSLENQRNKNSYSTYPVNPFILILTTLPERTRPATFEVTPTTTGKDFVSCLGEADRKGGGAGPSSGSIGIWCEWSKDGVMVEFGGDESRGPQAWEKGKDAVWKVIQIFPPISS